MPPKQETPARWAPRTGKGHFGKSTPPQPPKPEQAATARLSVADGQSTVGFIDVVAGRYHAIDTRGKVVGIFTTQLAASRALPAGSGRS